jgi:hypothetical protein
LATTAAAVGAAGPAGAVHAATSAMPKLDATSWSALRRVSRRVRACAGDPKMSTDNTPGREVYMRLLMVRRPALS